jgi:hypothetical protein
VEWARRRSRHQPIRPRRLLTPFGRSLSWPARGSQRGRWIRWSRADRRSRRCWQDNRSGRRRKDPRGLSAFRVRGGTYRHSCRGSRH